METVDAKEMLMKLVHEVEMADPNMLQVPAKKEPEDKTIVKLDENDFLRKLFIMSLMYKRQFEEAQLQAKWDEENKDAAVQASRCEDISKIYRDLFWLFVRDKYNLWKEESIGIKKGWEIVRCKPKEDNEPPDFIKKLFNLE